MHCYWTYDVKQLTLTLSTCTLNFSPIGGTPASTEHQYIITNLPFALDYFIPLCVALALVPCYVIARQRVSTNGDRRRFLLDERAAFDLIDRYAPANLMCFNMCVLPYVIASITAQHTTPASQAREVCGTVQEFVMFFKQIGYVLRLTYFVSTALILLATNRRFRVEVKCQVLYNSRYLRTWRLFW